MPDQKYDNSYQDIIDRIIAQMEKGVVPWKKPWTDVNIPRSYATGKTYKGKNYLLLERSGDYITIDRIIRMGGKLKEGATSYTLYKDINNKKSDWPVWEEFVVFHIDDTEGIPKKKRKKKSESYKKKEREKAEQLCDKYYKKRVLKVFHSPSNKASYNWDKDEISLPDFEQFKSVGEYYSTKFHEIIHSTGYFKRLKRLPDPDSYEAICRRFGDEPYSEEELIAEFGACFLMAELGIENQSTLKNSASYIEGWMYWCKDNKYFIPIACKKANQAVSYFLDIDYKKRKRETKKEKKARKNYEKDKDKKQKTFTPKIYTDITPKRVQIFIDGWCSGNIPFFIRQDVGDLIPYGDKKSQNIGCRYYLSLPESQKILTDEQKYIIKRYDEAFIKRLQNGEWDGFVKEQEFYLKRNEDKIKVREWCDEFVNWFKDNVKI